MHGEPGRPSRAPSCWPAASSTRPTTSTASCSSTGSTEAARKPAMKAIREAEWSGDRRPEVKVVAARHRRPRALGGGLRARSSSPARPAAAVPSLEALLDSRHDVVAVVTRPDAPAGRGRQLAAVAGRASSPTRPASRCSSRRQPRDPEFLARLRALAPDCCPVVAYGALRAAAPRSTSRRTAGSTCTSRCCRPGAAPRRCSTRVLAGDDVTGATTFLLEEGLDTGPVFGVLTETIRPTRHQPATCSTRLADGGADLLVAHPRRHRGRHARRRGRSRPTASRSRRSSPPTTPASTGPRPRCASTGWSARAPPRPAPGRRSRGERLKLGPVRLARPATSTLAPGRAARSRKAGVAVGTGDRRRRARRGQPAGQAGDGRPPTGRAASRLDRPDDVLGVTPAAADTGAPTRTRRAGGVRPAARRRRARRLRQPGAAAAAARARPAPAATQRSRPSWRTARCAAAAPTTRSWPPASTGRWTTSTRRCSTCCGSAPTSCCAMRVPAHAAVGDDRRAGPGGARRRAAPSSSTRCCAGSPAATSAPGWTRVAPARRADPLGDLALRTRTPRWIVRGVRATRSAVRPSTRPAARCWPPTTCAPHRDAGRPARPVDASTSCSRPAATAGPLVAVRRRPRRRRPRRPRGRAGRSRRRPGRGQPARRAGARPRCPSTGATSAGSTCAPAPAARPPCSRSSPARAAPG